MRRWLIGRRAYVLLLAITLVVRIATALPLQQAGYMDASYAIHVAGNLAAGRGLTEDVLWNYLDQPAGLPHPSNLYWMPLPSLLIAPLFVLVGVSYRVSQIPFILLSLFPPLFTFYLARKVLGRVDYAWIAALLTVFSGFYMVYWVSPDNFTPFALTASLCLYAIARGVQTGRASYLIAAGILAGLSHLSRADGILLLAVVPMASAIAYRYAASFKLQIARQDLKFTSRDPGALSSSRSGGLESADDASSTTPHRQSRFTFHASRFTFYPQKVWGRSVLRFTLYALLGYLLIMTPWFVRNYLAVGTPYPSAGAKTLWLTSYDELFRYANDLTLTRYLQWGILPILQSKVIAILRSLLILSFSDALLFLTPFVVIGLWRLRRCAEFLPFFIYAFLLFWVMVLAFTFPSWRGTLLHSGIALLPFCSVAAPLGVEAVVRWVARRRRTWDMARALPFFQIGSVALAAFLSFYIYGGGIFGYAAGSDSLLWNARDSGYAEIARWLERNGRQEDIVMAGDPVAFYLTSQRPAIVIPSDSVDAVVEAASRYHARYLVLDYDSPRPLKDVYEGKVSNSSLAPLVVIQDPVGHAVKLFEVKP